MDIGPSLRYVRTKTVKKVPKFLNQAEILEAYDLVKAERGCPNGAFLVGLELATGIYGIDLVNLTTTQFLTDPFRISLGIGKWAEVDPLFINQIIKRIEFCEEIPTPWLFYRSNRPTMRMDWKELNREKNKFMLRFGIFDEKRHQRALRLSFGVRALIELGWSQRKISSQLSIPISTLDWMFLPTTRNKLSNKYHGIINGKSQVKKQPGIKGEKTIFTLLKYYTDSELCQVYKTLLRLEQESIWKEGCFFVRLILGTGLRVSEATSLTTSDIDLAYDPPVVMVKNGKGNKPRAIQVIPEFAKHLRKYMNNKPDGWLFPSHLKKYPHDSMGVCSMKDLWKRVILETGVRYLSVHKGRHTFATWESERLTPHKLKDKLGHSSLDMTEEFYRHGIVGRDYTDKPPQWRAIAALMKKPVEEKEELF